MPMIGRLIGGLRGLFRKRQVEQDLDEELLAGRSLAMTALGIVLGLAGAMAVTRYLETLLFDLTPLDPVTFLSASLLFATVAAIAAFVPARRATKVDPMNALRCE